MSFEIILGVIMKLQRRNVMLEWSYFDGLHESSVKSMKLWKIMTILSWETQEEGHCDGIGTLCWCFSWM